MIDQKTSMGRSLEVQKVDKDIPEIKVQFDQLEAEQGVMAGLLARLEERLGFVMTPSPGTGEAKGSNPQPSRSPAAHNLFCAAENMRRMNEDLVRMMRSLEV